MPILGILASSRPAFELVGSYDSLATVTLSANTNTITFAGIPAGYKHLQLRYLSRSTRSSASDSVSFRFNGDSGSNYARHILYGDGSSAGAVATTSSTLINCGLGAGASAGASMFGGGVVDILDYTSTTKNKTIRTLTGVDVNGSGGDLRLGSGLWFATPAAINSVTIYAQDGSADFVQYSSFALYGIK